jgi:hypothetical protein
MDNQYMNQYMKKRYVNRRAEAIIYLGGVCVICFTTQNLDFHHENSEEKKFTIAKGSSFSNERFWSEIDKCILLCKDCHHTQHTSTYPCGTPQKYWRGCRCDDCKAANSKHCREYKSRRRST